MLEILYRIYEVADEETAKKNRTQDANVYLFSSKSKAENIELVMDCMICDSRDQFKEIIKDSYGNIPFKYSQKLKPHDLYCVIIGEHCYNSEKYFLKNEYDCAFCGSHVTSYGGHAVELSDGDIKYELFNIQDLKKHKFCSSSCRDSWKVNMSRKLKPDEDTHFFVTRDMFTSNIAGYIYKITKKSTQEFYVGQTAYAPMFRWAEHMKTDRFPIEDIHDYQFEVLEIVPATESLLGREKHYIQSLYKENPDKSLNILQTQLLRKEIN